mgnify:FL=1
MCEVMKSMKNFAASSLAELFAAPYVIWGTGRVAQAFYRKYCKTESEKPIFWVDSNATKHGSCIDGIEIFAPEAFYRRSEAAYVKGERLSVVIGATGIFLLEILSLMERKMVKAAVYSAVQLDAACYFSEERARVEKIARRFADEKSRYIYESIIRNMKGGRLVDFSLYEPNQYFGNDVIGELARGEVFVDAGVCHGEEIDRAIHGGNIFVHGFEPDAENYAYLLKKYEGRDDVRIHPCALWDKDERLVFQSNAATPSASRLTGADAHEEAAGIAARPLDDVLQGAACTLLKMDIEGAEYNALLGAAKTIEQHRPKLAVCVYHSLEDYVRIPELLMERYPFYRFFLRQHSATSGETVLYAL